MIYFISKSECRVCTRAHIGTQKKGGNILTLVPYLVMYITSYSIRIVLLSRYVNIYDTMAPMSGLDLYVIENFLSVNAPRLSAFKALDLPDYFCISDHYLMLNTYWDIIVEVQFPICSYVPTYFLKDLWVRDRPRRPTARRERCRIGGGSFGVFPMACDWQ